MRWLGWVVLLAGCVVNPLEPHWPTITPLPHWEAEYRWTWTACGQLTTGRPKVAYAALRWQVVPGSRDRFFLEGDEVHAAYHPESRTIVLSEMVAGESMAASWIRRHEMLHAQTGQRQHNGLFAFCERAFVDHWTQRQGQPEE